MQRTASHSPPVAAAAPPPGAADLFGQLTTARQELDRLQALLADACAELLHHFSAATEAANTAPAAARHLAGAVTALQFQDLASQLIQHTSSRLRDCAEQVTGTPADPAHARLTPTNPVAQAAMAGGSVELF